jgi:PKD repeat protein
VTNRRNDISTADRLTRPIEPSGSWRPRLLALLACCGLALGAQSAMAQTAQGNLRPKPAFPTITLPERAQGERAIALLGNRLPELAAYYGMTAQEFARTIRTDRTLWIDRQGRVYYEEEVRMPPQGAAAPSSTDPLSPTLEPLDQTLKLHSRPGAKRTIYLNFVGATLTGTAWNQSTGQSSITALPFDLDGVPYSFSNAELERIQYIWKRVAEDYSAFDVDVTTEPPAADRITRSSSSDDTFGTVALITKRTFYNCSCGGVAYLTTFDDVGDYYKPALVFYDALGSGNEKYVADAISHEVGHNVGLSHDGTSTSGYYQGHGSGATGWAPIMGVGYYQQLVQWSKGEYAGANNTQDDYVVMQNTGLPIRTDDHGNTLAAATPLASSTVNSVTTFSGSGVIERPSDLDAFSFVAGAGSVTINVSPAPRGPKLDIIATLRNGAGVVLATSNPLDSLPASLSATVASPGTYFVTVDGTGKGDPLGTGYTDYGSIGQYTISGTAQASASQPPVAALTATPTSGVAPLIVNFSAAGSTDPDGSIVAYAWDFGDGGGQTGGVSVQRTYSSPGTYTATLTVTDNAGLTNSKAVTISASPQVAVTTMHVAGIAMSLRTFRNGNADALATVTVRDSSGNLVSGATVSGSWSGVVSGNASVVTGSSGSADFRSRRVKAPAGSVYTFTVTGITLPGIEYNATQNVETSESISR